MPSSINSISLTDLVYALNDDDLSVSIESYSDYYKIHDRYNGVYYTFGATEIRDVHSAASIINNARETLYRNRPLNYRQYSNDGVRWSTAIGINNRYGRSITNGSIGPTYQLTQLAISTDTVTSGCTYGTTGYTVPNTGNYTITATSAPPIQPNPGLGSSRWFTYDELDFIFGNREKKKKYKNQPASLLKKDGSLNEEVYARYCK